MARRSKKPKLDDLPGQSDPQAPLDPALLLAAAQPVLKALDRDLLARAKASPAVTAALKARHAQEKAAKRTADGFAPWQTRFVGQVGAAWLLSCVFVRTLEDRGLRGQHRIAGPGAADSQRLFFELAPSLTERDYLLTLFRELAHHPAAAALFDARHNPIWLLAPSAEGAKALLALFRTPHPDTPALRFGQPDTRFLGDLYQDLDEGVRKRFALLQTPAFVERFILDRTLEPALETFGWDDTELIDPTCGSGHFLLGAYDRLHERLLRERPGLAPREAALLALGKVFGADINPYAVAIARFRLTLAYLEKAGFPRLADAPAPPLNLAVADSLLYNPQLDQAALWEQEGADAADWEPGAYALEDAAAAKAVLHRRYAAVVGNPPYITVKDKVLRDRYRALYASAHRSYSLSVPFCERFFQLARPGGRVGQITSNSFMKREFGSKLIEEYLPTINLELIVNTSGAYIPGHGTPTVLLFGTPDAPLGDDVLTVLAKRGEPTTPADPAKGLVWTSIVQHWDEVGHDDAYISVSRVDRALLERHPWTLAGGGAMELKALLEERAAETLDDRIDGTIGRAARTGHDEVYFYPPHVASRLGIHDDWWMDLVVGEAVRDWSLGSLDRMLFPYDRMASLSAFSEGDARSTEALRHLWPFRTVLADRSTFQGKMNDAGLRWFEYMQYTSSANETPLTITFAFVATHNHFVLDRGGKVFNRSAPIIKLPETATEEDHLALLAYLNSSTACFWMKQVMMDKGATSDRGVLQADEDKFRYEFDGTKMKMVPLPPPVHRERLIDLARRCDALAQRISQENYSTIARDHGLAGALAERAVNETDALHSDARRHLVALQEEIDWTVYSCFGLTDDNSLLHDPGEFAQLRAASSNRPFLCMDEKALTTPQQKRRRIALGASKILGTLETTVYKRRWYRSQGKFNAEAITDETLKKRASEDEVGRRLELTFHDRLGPVPITAVLRDAELPLDSCTWAMPCPDPPGEVLNNESVPFLAALRYTDSGLEKRRAWEETWALQAKEDAGEDVGPIPVPPKYAKGDFRDPQYYRLRGKLDVPKERFIAYPGCESDEDGEPVYGWAGWDNEQRAKALATLYYARKTQEGWEKARLTPMLAGLLELLFWLELWHGEPSDDYGGVSPAEYYRSFVDGECQALGLSHDDLKSWRPPEKTGRRGR